MISIEELSAQEIVFDSGEKILFVAHISRNGKQFDLSISLEKWQTPEVIASHLQLYADMLLDKKAIVNDIESLDH